MDFKRRTILKSLPLITVCPDLFAETLLATPRQAAGPFYPDKLPLDSDNDLIIVNNSLTPAVGRILNLSGTVFNLKGMPVNNALVEIWQCDANGRYIHSRDYNESENDHNFQGYGRFQTNATGGYLFRTIRPVPYGSGYARRSPHIHFSITANGHKPLVTQMYLADENNSKDGIWSRLSVSERESVTVRTRLVDNTLINEQAATFNIILA